VTLPHLPTRRYRRKLSAIVMCALLIGLAGSFVTRAAAAPADATASIAQEHETAGAKGEAAGGEEHGWGGTIAKAVNFAVLVGVLVYFLRSPIATHLRTRSETIRKDLVDAANLRKDAERQLSDVRSQLAALPAELAAVRQRGEEELAGERVRMQAATARVREQLLERTRRDIDIQFRQARRALVEHTADLAVGLARKRIEREITPEDQARLVDRYAAGVTS
jgi:F-type H+-transporting ATPase subunit b